MRNSRCHKCKEVIEGEYRMVSLDIPYRNVFFHLECYREIESNLEEYLKLNAESIIHNYPSEYVKKPRKW
jgi:hypothetical protein